MSMENDFSEWIEDRSMRLLNKHCKGIAQIATEQAQAGMFRSSNTIRRLVEHADEAMEDMANSLFHEVDAAVSRGGERNRLTEITVGVFSGVADALISETRKQCTLALGPLKSPNVHDLLRNVERSVKFYSNQFEAGNFRPEGPLGRVMTNNNIKIENMTNSSINQGAENSNIIQTVKIDSERAFECLQKLLEMVPSLPEQERKTVEADLLTIQAQLHKPSPSVPILTEAGKSLRSISESLVASTIHPQFSHWVAMLLAAIVST